MIWPFRQDHLGPGIWGFHLKKQCKTKVKTDQSMWQIGKLQFIMWELVFLDHQTAVSQHSEQRILKINLWRPQLMRFNHLSTSGPISSILVNMYGSRPVVILGGLLCCAGMVLASYSHSLIELYLTAGLTTGKPGSLFI